MERKKFLLLMSMLISSLSFAGNEVGNGGLGFFCSKTDQYVLLDFFEYELLHPEKKIIASSGSFEKILGERLSLLEKLDKKNSQLYSKKTAEIVKKINYLNDITLSKTDDSFEIASPLGCELRQFAIQKKNSSDNSVDFYFDKKIWEKLDAKTRAGLVLHILQRL